MRTNNPTGKDTIRKLFDDKEPERYDRTRSKVINAAFGDPDNAEVKRQFNLSRDDFAEVFERMRNLRPYSEAELALHDPEILRWFFTNLGLEGKFTRNTSVEFGIMIMRNAKKER